MTKLPTTSARPRPGRGCAAACSAWRVIATCGSTAPCTTAICSRRQPGWRSNTSTCSKSASWPKPLEPRKSPRRSTHSGSAGIFSGSRSPARSRIRSGWPSPSGARSRNAIMRDSVFAMSTGSKNCSASPRPGR
ncbi:hypothetical protein SDC9_138245 [bioreactor metagenome]|uniref:Uncharacterized protein n=1 Tax=bioreactor metagenome TaxID=1076179 RepID=A0A645DPH3_9ZZZZ